MLNFKEKQQKKVLNYNKQMQPKSKKTWMDGISIAITGE